MDHLNWDLSVLHRSISYPNLSGAAAHVGISQPQLSRIVSRIEERLGVVLLDREARRKSAWTPAAYRVAEIYAGAFRKFRAELSEMVEGTQMHHLRIGTLEGLSDLALQFCDRLLQRSASPKVIEVNVYDLNELEQVFAKQNLELIFTSREPGKRKFKYLKNLGFQTIDRMGSGAIEVMSTFEFNTLSHQKQGSGIRTLVSNSLEIRKKWLQKTGTTGLIPSPLRKKKLASRVNHPILMIGSDALSEKFWDELK